MSLFEIKVATSTLNLRFLLRQKNPDPESWPGILRSKSAGICQTEGRALQLINGAEINDDEVEAVFEFFNFGQPDDLRSARLFEQSGESILKLNLEFLLKTLPHGWKRRLAYRLDIKQETISRWITKGVPPEKKNIQGVIKFFGLPENTNLNEEPLFLSTSPLGVFAQKAWLQTQIERIPSSHFGRVFPALEKIFRTDEKY